MRQKNSAGLGALSICLLAGFAGILQPIYAAPTNLPQFEQIAQNSNPQDAEALFQQALHKTQRQDFRGAIATLKKAAALFAQENNTEQAYKSQALAEYLTWDLKDATPPNWYIGGSCFGEPLCRYIVTHVAPNFSQDNSNQGTERATQKNDFGGILMLLKPLRYRPSSTGGQTPVNAVLDVQLIPQLLAEEFVNTSSCMLDGKPDAGIVALVKISKSDRDADLFKQIRQAWRLNLKTEKIETIPTTNISCVNPCPGGC
ncbi:hypothetical protein V2H45_04870 [Tumidithrix elongata RA019]|uniref:Uncharacterized protein n=1 Tax=Tumidithrix elongata BACA0141 TaxID=2716417 RepID=A0AAW9PYV2_9CYAN|nr:hypothetical protein [Tumidithrix elongata RA019]